MKKNQLEIQAISIRQPWASALSDGICTILNRKKPTLFRGQFLIHASSNADAAPELEWMKQRLAPLLDAPGGIHGLPKKCLLGIAHLIECVPLMSIYQGKEYNDSMLYKNKWATGPHCWRAATAFKFSTPIPFAASSALFRVRPDDLRDAIAAVAPDEVDEYLTLIKLCAKGEKR